MTIHVGTCGWQYRSWRGGVYPDGIGQARWLSVYAGLFATVEADSAFYRLPARATFERWAAGTPDDFVVAVKASRFLTHVKRLKDPEEPVLRLAERVAGLGSKLGPLLLQLPPRFAPDAGRLDATLAACPAGWRVAVELRDDRWHVAEVRRVLERHGAALCLADRRGALPPRWRTADWTYLRLHEGRASPEPCYGRQALASWAGRLRDGWGPDGDVWVYFNNDPRACAPANALGFAAACRRLGMDVARTARPQAVARPRA